MKTRKKMIALSVIGLLIVGLASLLVFTDFGKELLNVNTRKGVLIDAETGKASAYSFEILKIEDIEKEAVKSWVNRSVASEKLYDNPVYYTLYNNASDGMNMYLFMPEAKEVMGDIARSNIKITEAGTSLMIHIDTDEKTMYDKESTDLILHVYANGNAKVANAKTETLIINGKTYAGVSSTFMMLD